MVRPWVCSPIVTSSSSLRATYPRHNLVTTAIYMASNVLRVPLTSNILIRRVRVVRLVETIIVGAQRRSP